MGTVPRHLRVMLDDALWFQWPLDEGGDVFRKNLPALLRIIADKVEAREPPFDKEPGPRLGDLSATEVPDQRPILGICRPEPEDGK
jgi:hypothetical protein